MPIQLHEESPDGIKLFVWRLTETEEDLLKFLESEKNINNILLDGINHPLRRRQKLVSRILIEEAIPGKWDQLTYSENGKPQLKGQQGFISFSNTKNYIAFIYHPHLEIGVDIEEQDKRIHKIASRFINQIENKWLNLREPELDLYLIWGAKESVFKAKGGGGIHFKNHIEVLKPDNERLNQRNGLAFYRKCEKPQLFHYHFRNLEDYVLVYTIAEYNSI